MANQIINLSVYGAAQNESYNRLANFTDKFGYRLAGTQNLEDAIGLFDTVHAMKEAISEVSIVYDAK